MTAYLGDKENKKLIVLGKKDDMPIYIDLSHKPISGVLMKNEKILLIGCEKGQLYTYDISPNP